MRPYQMRRHARRMRRYGLQPMVVINSGDQLPDLALVLACRALWRYRSELAPLVLAVATAFAGLVLHLTRPHWWPWVLAATVAAAGVLLGFGHHVGLSLLPERVYAAAVTLAAGTWLATGIAISPTHPPLPAVLILGGLTLAVPWWAHRRRRARVRVERTLAAWPQIAEAVGLAGSRVMSAVIDMWGWRARLGLARGQTINDVTEKLRAIESALGTRRGAVRVYPTPDDLAHRVDIRVLNVDPHAAAVPWPGPSVTSITEPVELGPFEDAAPARVSLLRRHALFGGIAGSGKSGGVNLIMGSLSACRDVVVWAVDLKRGMELGPWAACLDRLATTPDQARALLHDAVAVLEARAAHLAATGRRVWDPTPGAPALVIIIDEYAELAEHAAPAMSDTDSIARRGRAVAVTLIAATQRPTQKAMGQGAVRSQMDIRVSFRVRERRDTDLILGQGMLKAGWQAHTLNAPGKFLISAPEHDTPRRARAYLLTDDAVSETARRYAGQRPPLDEISRRAITEPYTGPQPAGAHALGSDDRSGPARDPDLALWDALSGAPEQGIPTTHLMIASGMSRRTLYRRLKDHIKTGRVIQISHGRYRATRPDHDQT
jgi:S-DNA-T family DNA segregation ATPase FtsK/SpoIIIE